MPERGGGAHGGAGRGGDREAGKVRSFLRISEEHTCPVVPTCTDGVMSLTLRFS